MDAAPGAAAAAFPPPLAAAAPPLLLLGDDIFVLIAAELDARMLGRLGCAAQRFWRVSVPDPAHTTDDPAPPELWSVVEDGATGRPNSGAEIRDRWTPRGKRPTRWAGCRGLRRSRRHRRECHRF